MSFDALVLRDGDRVTATGLLIRNHEGDWLQPHLPVAGPGGTPGQLGVAGRGADYRRQFRLPGQPLRAGRRG
jgi:hypothetical protein